MKRLLVILLATFAFTGALNNVVHAEEGKDAEAAKSESNNNAPCKKSCKFGKGSHLSAEQMEKIKQSHFRFREKQIEREKAIKLARLNYEKISSDDNADFAALEAASQEVIDNISKMIALKYEFKHHIAFKILTPEQRKQFRSHMMMRKCSGHCKGLNHEGRMGPFAEETSDENLTPGTMVSMEDAEDSQEESQEEMD